MNARGVIPMATIPKGVTNSDAMGRLLALGYALLYQGKVGELYDVPGKPDQLLMVRSDRLSIFDFVLPCFVQRKGVVLVALTHYWLTQVFTDVPNHLLAWGSEPEKWIAAGWDMSDVSQLPLERTMLVRRCDIWPYEMIFRGHIGGSVWKQYQADGTVAGVQLPVGLSKWQKLDTPMFTPTTKEESGHDKAIALADYTSATGDIGPALSARDLDLYVRAYDHAAERGLVLLDTKFENGTDGSVVDEILTPDSSRYTTPEDLAAAIAEGRDPIFYDKEPVRIWGRGVVTPWGTGLQGLDPEEAEHLAFMADLEIPTSVTDEAEARYMNICHCITGLPLDTYLSEVMRV